MCVSDVHGGQNLPAANNNGIADNRYVTIINK